MSSLDDRRDAFEKKYAHDEEMKFRLEARTCKLFGQWVAEQLGLTGSAAEDYARTVIGANLEEPGYGDVKRKVRPDLDAKKLNITDNMLDRQLAVFTEQAKKQIIEAGN